MSFLSNRKTPYFIAEIGSNHLKNLQHTLALIEELAKNGADAIKFQLFEAERLYSKNAPAFPGEKELPYNVAKAVELPQTWLKELKPSVEKHGADFLCSPFSLEDVDILEEINVSAYKVASSEINDVVLIRHMAMTKKPMFLSVAMAKLADIELALETIDRFGPCEVCLLQCTALYPTPPDEVNLVAMKTMKDTFGREVGFSDHTLGIHISLAAVALGARVIEKHVTMDRTSEGPDHFFALLPEEFGHLVARSREIIAALGSRRKIIGERELAKRHLSQRSIVTKRRISKGEIFRLEDLTTKRPGYGIPPMFLALIVGHHASRDISEDDVVRWEDVLA
jgi:N-acetylneuraminate synthase/N,N'-diacetyllegionaminate synthase